MKQTLVTCHDVAFSYEGRTVCEQIDMHINAGDYLCIVGQNGSGKSTLIRDLVGLKAPSAGKIEFCNGMTRGDIGYLPQQTAAQKDFPASVREVVLSAGDSAVFVDDAEIVKIHVHTSDPGAVLSAAVQYGSLLTVKIENMRVQHSELSEGTTATTRPIVEGKYSFVSVANGDGICAVLQDLGVDEMVIGGQTMNPSTEQMLSAIDKTDGEYVFILPNNSNIILVAQQAADMLQDSGRKVCVIPSKSIPQGISALYAFDPEAAYEDNVAQMTEAMGGVCTLSMTQAVRDADIDGLHITKGQVLGLVNNKVEKVCNTLMECLESLMDHLVHTSCVTVFCGEDMDHDDAAEVTALLRGSLQEDTDLTVMDGGQPVYSLIISGE